MINKEGNTLQPYLHHEWDEMIFLKNNKVSGYILSKHYEQKKVGKESSLQYIVFQILIWKRWWKTMFMIWDERLWALFSFSVTEIVS